MDLDTIIDKSSSSSSISFKILKRERNIDQFQNNDFRLTMSQTWSSRNFTFDPDRQTERTDRGKFDSWSLRCFHFSPNNLARLRLAELCEWSHECRRGNFEKKSNPSWTS